MLVKNISRVAHIVVSTEMDALLLENNLIKKYQPRYNVMLKDDKTYPWICIKKEPFPRVFTTRKLIKDGADYFWPLYLYENRAHPSGVTAQFISYANLQLRSLSAQN